MEKVRLCLEKNGVNNFGFCSFLPFSTVLLPCRAQKRLPKNAQSIVCAVFPYKVPVQKRNLSRYAVVKDYHPVVMNRLNGCCQSLQAAFPGFAFSPFADNSPLPEVQVAVRCGLGMRGDNGLLIHPVYGTWVFLGEIVTDLPLPAALPGASGCLHCKKCEKNCPTGALKGGKVDERLCLSAVTQKKGELSPREKELIQKTGVAWGCDLCQECCPLNQGAADTPLQEFLHSAVPVVSSFDADKRADRAFLWRGRAVIARNLCILEEKTAKTTPNHKN